MIRTLFRRTPAWRAGLVHIWCTVCGRDLDWAQPEFVALHPSPVCANCCVRPRTQHSARQAAEPTVIHATAEVIRREPRQLEAASPVNLAFEAAVAEAEEVQR